MTNQLKMFNLPGKGYNSQDQRNWMVEDRPDKKILLKGTGAMSDSEILANIIGGPYSLKKTRDVLFSFNNSLFELSKASFSDIKMRTTELSDKNIIQILSAFTIGRRTETRPVDKISNSRDAFDIFKKNMEALNYEEFWIILLNKANKIVNSQKISEGGVSGTVVDPKKIFKIALDHHASSIILGHNHPSGVTIPSEADKKITSKIREAGIMLDIAVLDHIIVGGDQYYSFADEGTI